MNVEEGIPSSKRVNNKALNNRALMTRTEFLEALVRIAIGRYARTKGSKYADISEAVVHLCRDDILPRVPVAARHDSNDFRRKYCYLEQVPRRNTLDSDYLRRIYCYLEPRRSTLAHELLFDSILDHNSTYYLWSSQMPYSRGITRASAICTQCGPMSEAASVMRSALVR